MPEVWIPSKLQQLTGGKQQIQVEGGTVRQVINSMEKQYPGVKGFLCDEMEEDLMPGIAVIVDGETSQLGMLQKVREDSEVHFLPALGGG